MNPQQASSPPISTEHLSEVQSETRGQTDTWLSRIPRFIKGSRALLWGVALVVVLVSLPLLQSVALKENELDALRALHLLGNEVFAAETPVDDFSALLGPGSELARRLPDTRLVGDGRVMFHHGYLFEIVPTVEGSRQLCAWPMAHGKSGIGACCFDASGEVLGHPNGRAQWSGVNAAPFSRDNPGELTMAAGWRPLVISANQTRAGI